MPKRKTHDEFVRQIKNLVGKEYVFHSRYETTHKKMEVTHSECGYSYQITPHAFLKGGRCPKCRSYKGRGLEPMSHDFFLERVKKQSGDEYRVLTRYENYKTKVLMLHVTCGKTFESVPAYFFSGNGCPDCGKRKSIASRTKTNETFLKEVHKLVGDEYTFLENYINSSTKIKAKHNVCGLEYFVRPNDFRKGHRCAKCSSSKGEEKIRDYLVSMNIDFREQYRIKECRNKRPLPFDFAVFENNELIALIEYDGKQHFHAYDSWGGVEKFETTKRHDAIKNNYCQRNNIRLLRIKYTKLKQIEFVLEKYFSKERIFTAPKQLKLL